jgi:hypothetical protein
MVSCLGRGFETPQSWNPVLKSLFEALNSSPHWFGFSFGDGEEAHKQYRQIHKQIYPVIEQVKEKFGNLCVYYDWQNDVAPEYRDLTLLRMPALQAFVCGVIKMAQISVKNL